MKFDECCEAYTVLCNAELKAIYDKYGAYGLKEGIVLPDGTKCGGGWFMIKSSNDVYEEEFASSDPFAF